MIFRSNSVIRETNRAYKYLYCQRFIAKLAQNTIKYLQSSIFFTVYVYCVDAVNLVVIDKMQAMTQCAIFLNFFDIE